MVDMQQTQQDKIWDYYENENQEGFATNYGRLKYLINYSNFALE